MAHLPPPPLTIPWLCQGVADVAKQRGSGGEIARDQAFRTNTSQTGLVDSLPHEA